MKYSYQNNLNNINSQLQPTADEIKAKMEALQSKYNFKIDFAFPQITMDEVLGEIDPNPPEFPEMP